MAFGKGMGMGMGMGMGHGMGMGMGMGHGMGQPDFANPDAGIPPHNSLMPRSYYATPHELRRRPWTLKFSPDNTGAVSFPSDYRIDPNRPGNEKFAQWTEQDWDPALRFWTRDFDPTLIEWLKAAEPAEPSIVAALEFADQYDLWHPIHVKYAGLGGLEWIEQSDLLWYLEEKIPGTWPAPDADPATWPTPEANDRWVWINAELEQLADYMSEERLDYLDESDVQADHLHEYVIQFVGANQRDHPWTMELINCGLAIGNLVYMSYKAEFNRVRPSLICPGLIPPFGPPMHPAFPSGHSFLAHFLALLLLEVPYIHQRLGVDRSGALQPAEGSVFNIPEWSDLRGSAAIKSPLLLLAQRIAVNRERIGVHYPSDSSASRHLAAGIWDMIVPDPVGRGNIYNQMDDGSGNIIRKQSISCPMFDLILKRAKAEWP